MSKVTFVVTELNKPSTNALEKLHASVYLIIKGEQKKDDSTDARTA